MIWLNLSGYVMCFDISLSKMKFKQPLHFTSYVVMSHETQVLDHLVNSSCQMLRNQSFRQLQDIGQKAAQLLCIAENLWGIVGSDITEKDLHCHAGIHGHTKLRAWRRYFHRLLHSGDAPIRFDQLNLLQIILPAQNQGGKILPSLHAFQSWRAVTVAV